MTALAATSRPFAFEKVRFEANRGQTSAGVRFLARAPGQQVFLTDSGVAISTRGGGGVEMHFEGAGRPDWRAAGTAAETISYYIGKDPSRWVKGAPVYERIVWRNAYPGIDVAFYGVGERLEYDLMVAPGADPSRIRVRFDGGGPARVLDDGTVQIEAGGATIRQLPPAIYQELTPGKRVPVEGRFVACGANRMRLELGSYRPTAPLVVDPVLEASTYVGGENDDEIVSVADGFVAGNTRSLALPGVAVQLRKSRDIFVRGTGQVVAGQITEMTTTSTVVLGGSGDEELGGIYVSSWYQGVVLAGTTTSSDLPMSGSGAGSTYHGGASDGFLAQVSVSTTRFYLSSTSYAGGSGEDRILAISGYGQMWAYAGQTDSPDLASGSAPVQTLQGGKDGFYAIRTTNSAASEIRGYLGGAGDDAAYAISIHSNSLVWVGGETRSADFPFETRGIAGPSDAFLTSITIGDPYTASPTVTQASYRFGGSGEDRIRAIVTNPSSTASSSAAPVVSPGAITGIGIAGVTTSPDLPASNGAQSTPGGGSDGFAGIWDTVSTSLRWLSYVGGSGTDELTAIAQNWAGDLYVAGWTSSTDLHTVNAVQPAAAGGEDGLFAVFDYEGGLHQLSYFGGSGDDRIRDVHVNYNLVARVAGSTRSQDLPQQAATQPPGGGLDGFIADIGTDYLVGATSMILAKDGILGLSIRTGRTDVRRPLTFRSSDPSRVRLVYMGKSLSELTTSAGNNIGVEALADSGQATIEVSAAGYDTKTIRVQLYPGAFDLNSNRSPMIVSTWSSTSYVYAPYWAIDPATDQPIGPSMILRPGVVPPVFQWSVSDPSILKATAPGTTTQLTPLRAGEVTLRFSAPGYDVRGELTVKVQPPTMTFPPAGIHVGRDLVSSMSYYFMSNGNQITSGFRGTLTARSGDPIRLLLSTNSVDTGKERVTVTMVNSAPGINAQALASEGTVPVYFTSDQFEGEIVAMVQLEPAVVNWGLLDYNSSGSVTPAERVTLAAGAAQTSMVLSLQSESGRQGSYRPGLPPLVYKLRNSNPQVLEQNRITSDSNLTVYTVKPLAPGSADLTLSVSDPNLRLSTPSVHVDVVAPVLLGTPPPSTVWVGKKLQTSFEFRYYGNAPVEVTSEDPSAVVVSRLSTEPGSERTAIQESYQNSSSYTVWVQALKGEGETNVRLRFPTGEEATVRVVLLQAAAGFTSSPSNYSSSTGFNGRVNVGVWAVDAASGIGIMAQPPAPGTEIEVRFRSEGAPLKLDRTSVKLTTAAAQAEVNFLRPDSGKTSTLIAEADGDFAPTPRVGSVVVAGTIPATGPISLGIADVPQNGLRSYPYNTSSSKPMTITIADPGLALLSASPQDAGAASIKVERSSPTIYIHGLAPSGLTNVRFEQEGEVVRELSVSLTPLQLSLSGPAILVGATTTLQLSSNSSAGLRPGAGPVQVAFRVADPSIAKVSPETLDYDGTAGTGKVNITGVAAGTTTLYVEPAQDVFAPSSPYSIAVGTPQVQTASYMVGKNQQGAVQLDLGSNFASPSGSIVTLTSSDPTRLLLSRSQTTVGAASITVSVAAGERRTQVIYMQALEMGSASISASGISQPIATVQVAPSWWSCGTQLMKLVLGATQSISCGISSPANSAYAYYVMLSLRPGLGDLKVGFSSSASDIFTVTPELAAMADSRIQVTLKALGEGSGELRVQQPAGFQTPSSGADVLPVSVARPQLSYYCFGSDAALPKDTQVTCRIPAPSGMTVTAKSEQPELLLASADAKQPGGASATTVADSQGAAITFQALAGYGTAEVVLSAPGYQDFRQPVALRGTSITLGNYSGSSTINLQSGALTTMNVQMRLSGGGVMSPRAGVKIPVTVTATPGGIVSLTPAELLLTSDESSSQVQIRAVAPGSTLLTLTVPDGFATTTTPILITVTK